MIKTRVFGKSVKLKINGIPALLSNIVHVDITEPGIYSSLVDEAIVDRSMTAVEESITNTIGKAKIGYSRIS